MNKKSSALKLALLVGAIAMLDGAMPAHGVEKVVPAVGQADPSRSVPDTVSDSWKKSWPLIMKFISKSNGPFPRPDDFAGWEASYLANEKRVRPLVAGSAKMWRVETREVSLGGVPVLRIVPSNWHDDGRVLIYVHGGGFTSGSVYSSLGMSTQVAAETGLQVISVDYTVAPRGRWQQVTDQVIAAYKAVLAEGVAPESIAMIGESAGGSIVAGTTLKLRDLGLPMPAAVILWSPWADISGAGDTYRTLADAEPMLTIPSLNASALAYADVADQKNPYVSPVYGDFSKGYPPTLIQGGTREVFLSNCVRLYQSIKAGGGNATLDLYEGMIHVFQSILPNSPESKSALRAVRSFIDRNVKARGNAAVAGAKRSNPD
ncbi:alpha/beta hydrolase [Massilia phosphatilytica]|nr:alpha/beta hydrolase [Massilia phosphatilytica]